MKRDHSGELAGRVAVVTGSSRGIGRALVLALAAAGADVVVSGKSETEDPRLPGTIHSVAEEVQSLGARAIAVRTDVRSESQVEALIQRTVDEFGRVDIVVSNAGALWWERVIDTPPKRYDLIWQVNVRAAYLAAYYALPHMVRQGWGHLLTNSPAITTAASPGKAAYMTTKMGMSRLALGIAAEHLDDNVAANALWPAAPIDTAATRNWGSAKMGEPTQWRRPEIYVDAALEILTSEPRTCTGRMVTDEEILTERGWSAEDLDDYWLTGDAPAEPLWIDGRTS
ncbi:SDR family oxidoreductase [Kribbella kalugense]|uniref:Citronellol/citronellal dehydrogenase n=1 Tax=Kribbella kalugense TaxID=2512221 RepID=A0A4R7ZIW7_9ACTN|nr:SDR family oxidoreductase [Kribbella kalugense]TDW17687.1 citronellol/citronellal dehydrogenase [Kribbella kalugense]